MGNTAQFRLDGGDSLCPVQSRMEWIVYRYTRLALGEATRRHAFSFYSGVANRGKETCKGRLALRIRAHSFCRHLVMPTKTVVLIEDETIVRQMLRLAVEKSTGLKVVAEFGDGREGLEYCLKQPPDMVICDLSLPGMHGFDVIRCIREKQQEPRILILTSRIDANLPVQSAALGVQGYVDKTKPLPVLLEAVKEVAGGGIYFAAKVNAPEPIKQPEQGIALHLPVIAGADPLSPREIEVAKLVAEGFASKEIADKLVLSVRTVEKHRANIMDKTGVRDVASLTRYCIHYGLVHA